MKSMNPHLTSDIIMEAVNAHFDVYQGLDGVRPIGYQWAIETDEKAAKRAIRSYTYRKRRQPESNVTDPNQVVSFEFKRHAVNL